MSRVSIAIRRAPARNATLKAIRPVLHLPLADLLRAIDSGAPLIDAELFTNDFADVADSLRNLIQALDGQGVDYVVSEDGDEITAAVLLTILEGSESYRP